MLYLYLASNADGFLLALSPVAIRQAVGMPASTYRDQFIKLIDKGYLVQRGESHIYDFFEIPQHATQSKRKDTACADGVTAAVLDGTKGVENAPSQDIEININKTDKINNYGVEKQVSPQPTDKFGLKIQSFQNP